MLPQSLSKGCMDGGGAQWEAGASRVALLFPVEPVEEAVHALRGGPSIGRRRRDNETRSRAMVTPAHCASLVQGLARGRDGTFRVAVTSGARTGHKRFPDIAAAPAPTGGAGIRERRLPDTDGQDRGAAAPWSCGETGRWGERRRGGQGS